MLSKISTIINLALPRSLKKLGKIDDLCCGKNMSRDEAMSLSKVFFF